MNRRRLPRRGATAAVQRAVCGALRLPNILPDRKNGWIL